MKTYLTLGLVVALVFSMGVALAAKPDLQKSVSLEKAKKVSPNVFYLGKAWHDGKLVEGYAIVKYKKDFAKPETECGNGICEPGENINKCPVDCGGGEDPEEPDTSSCYVFLARGAKWKTVEPYVVNPSNTEGLTEAFVTANFAADVAKWEAAAGTEIIGLGSSTGETLVADTESPDNKNEVYFGSISEPGAIAVTIVWGVFGGPPKWRELVEWDQIYDQVDYGWSASGETGRMDFENIATHELGHTFGLGDLYNSECSEVTMYGYASYGETKKSTLEAGDITGVKKLYA